MLSTRTFDNGSVRRSCAKSIRAIARAAAYRTNAAVSCLASCCDWSDVGQAFKRCKHGSGLSRLPFRQCLDTLSARRYGFICNPLFGNAKSSSHGTMTCQCNSKNCKI